MTYTLGDRTDQRLHELIRDRGGSENADLIQEILTTGLKLIDDHPERGDLKIINSALKEIRHAFRVFAPYRGTRKVTIFGSARSLRGDPVYDMAFEFAAKIVKRGFMTITGAGPGIMEAGNAGAGRENTFGLGIRLPFEQSVNEFILGDPKVVNFKYFFTRKLIFVKETDALVLLPGGFGTMDEGFEVLTLIQTGKAKPMPVLCMDVPGGSYWPAWRDFLDGEMCRSGRNSPADLELFELVDSVDFACDIITRFYRNYHSSRYVGPRLVIRVQSFPSKELISDLTREFSDILAEGGFQVSEACPKSAGTSPSSTTCRGSSACSTATPMGGCGPSSTASTRTEPCARTISSTPTSCSTIPAP
jgi:uncharacterized protein (TIGR00730 family)